MRLLAACCLLAVTHTVSAMPAPSPQAGTGALPRLALDHLPAAMRGSLQAAYDAARARPSDPLAVGELAMMLHAHEQYRAADQCYQIVRQRDATSAAWPYLSGLVQAQLGEYPAAVASFRQAMHLDPEYLPARIGLADALLESGDLDAGARGYAALAGDLPELALAHYGLGRVASLRGDARKAAGHYERALDLAPQFGAAHYGLALAYRDLGAAQRAQPHLESYQRFKTRRPAPPDPLLDRVRAMRETARAFLAEGARLSEAGRLDDAIGMQLRALERDPATAQAHVNLIALYGRTGRPDEAHAHYQAALKLDGSLSQAHYNYGVLLASARRDDEAATAFRNALDADPFHAAAHNNLAALLARRGRFEEAAAHYRQALTNDPQHHGARLNLARVLILLDRRTEAAGHLRHALDRAKRAGDAALVALIAREIERIGHKQ